MSVQGEVTPFSIRMLSHLMHTIRRYSISICANACMVCPGCCYVLIMFKKFNPHSLRNEARGSTGHSDMFLLATSMFTCSTEYIYPG